MCVLWILKKILSQIRLKHENARMSLIWLYRAYCKKEYKSISCTAAFLLLSLIKNLIRERLKAYPEIITGILSAIHGKKSSNSTKYGSLHQAIFSCQGTGITNDTEKSVSSCLRLLRSSFRACYIL